MTPATAVPGIPIASPLGFSVVIPAFNEAAALPHLLDSLDRARRAYGSDLSAVEVILADNGSTDETGELARSRGCRVVSVAKRSIAAARNGGARAATKEVLAFVDADSQIHVQTFNAIARVLRTGGYVAGSTGVVPDRWSVGIAATYTLFLPFVWLSRMDTGVVFCRRVDYAAVGGYDEERFFAEDVAFLWSLRRLGRSRHQGLVRLRGVKTIASTRKFDQYGDWHYLTRMPRLGWAALRSKELPEFARRYWYGSREGDEE